MLLLAHGVPLLRLRHSVLIVNPLLSLQSVLLPVLIVSPCSESLCPCRESILPLTHGLPLLRLRPPVLTVSPFLPMSSVLLPVLIIVSRSCPCSESFCPCSESILPLTHGLPLFRLRPSPPPSCPYVESFFCLCGESTASFPWYFISSQ